MSKKILFCFTISGGKADFFDSISKYLESDIEVVKLEYAGHGERYREPFYQTLEELVDDLYPVIREKVQKKEVAYSFLGYSLGSIVASAMAQNIMKKREIGAPEALFLAAHEPKQRIELETFSDLEDNESVKKRVISFGNVPDRLIENKAYWRVYLPIYRADFAMIGRFDFGSLERKEEIPVTVFYSEEDVSFTRIQKWDRIYKKCDYVRYSGSHFFIIEHCEKMADVIKQKMLKEL